MPLNVRTRYALYYLPARVMRSPIHNFVKAVPLLASPQGRGIIRDWWSARSQLKTHPEDPIRKQLKTLDRNHDAAAVAIYHNLTGVPTDRIIQSGALDLMQIFYGHIFQLDDVFDKKPRPNLSDAKVEQGLRDEYVNPAREVFRQKISELFPPGSPRADTGRRLLNLFNDFNETAFNSLKSYQQLDSPTLDQTLKHREQTVGMMGRYGVRMMDEALGRSPAESRSFQDAFFHAAMAAQIHDDLTDVLLDDLAGTKENLVHAYLRHNGEYEAARPYFKIMTSTVLRNVAPKTYADFKKFDAEHVSKIPVERQYEILRKFPSVF